MAEKENKVKAEVWDCAQKTSCGADRLCGHSTAEWNGCPELSAFSDKIGVLQFGYTQA